VGGPDATVSTTSAGQNGWLTFTGSAGQRVALYVPTMGYPGAPTVRLYHPAADGSASTTTWSFQMAVGAGTFSDVIVLPANGTYSIWINPQSMNTGNMTLRLFSVPADVTGTISVGGPDATVSTTTAGQNGWLTFNGSGGQNVVLSAVTSTFSVTTSVRIYRPAADGSASTATFIYNGNWFSGNSTGSLGLPATGIYTIWINPQGLHTGALTLRLTSP
jgi:hypothetical protein